MPIGFRTLVAAVAAGTLLASAPASARVDDEPLARFTDRVCPGVAGLQRDSAETMVGVIRGNLEEFGVSTASEDTCVPNLIVAFVEDGQEVLRELSRQRDPRLGSLELFDRRDLLAEAGPARALLQVESRTRDGLWIPERDNLTDIPQAYGAMAHSRIYTASQNDIRAALILIDRNEIGGLTIAQLADYATFRALTRTLPPESARGDSIVGLFHAGTPRPAGLTEFDRTFLRTLYAGRPNLPGSARLAALGAATGYDFVGED